MTNIYKSTYSFSISPVQDQPIFGNLAWLGRPIDLQGLTIWNWPSQHGRAIQGHSLWESQNVMFTFTKWHFSTQYLTPKSKIVKLKNNSSLNDEPHSISHLSNHGTDLNTETTVCFTLLALFCPQPAHASSRQAHWSEKQLAVITAWLKNISKKIWHDPVNDISKITIMPLLYLFLCCVNYQFCVPPKTTPCICTQCGRHFYGDRNTRFF